MDLYGKDKGNVSLPPRLQSRDFKETKLKDIVINTQICLYNLKIAELNKRIQRLEERNKELENTLEDTDDSIKTLQEEKGKEISSLNSQITSYTVRTEEYKNQLAALEKSRINDKFTHTEKTKNIDEKYKNKRLVLISQIKLLSAKTNVLEDYKSMQHILEKKLNMKNQYLIHQKEQVAESLRQIEHKFRIDREKLKKNLYNCLVDLASAFQLKVGQHMPHSIAKLLSENIAISNQLSMIVEGIIPKKQDCILYDNEKGKYKNKINNAHLNAKRSIVIAKLEKSTIAILRQMSNKTDNKLSKIIKLNHLTEEQYVVNKDNAKIKARKCEIYVKQLEVLLYCEKEKLAIAKYQKQWVSDQLQAYLQMLYDVKYVLINLKTE
ncbi:cilia- and flagella-associated protein 157-like [Polyergus mexicanus]|uniref:cilia- and flagella-associated protein 157-like n=1 Tax=Polyergus mexicanus TaxID=615972 RepID=UPI0038B5837A